MCEALFPGVTSQRAELRFKVCLSSLTTLGILLTLVKYKSWLHSVHQHGSDLCNSTSASPFKLKRSAGSFVQNIFVSPHCPNNAKLKIYRSQNVRILSYMESVLVIEE